MAKKRKIPDELFIPAEGAIHDTSLRTLYSIVVEGLRTEAENTPGFGMIEAMLMERVAFLWIMIKDKERFPIGAESPTGELEGFAHERNHKDILATWQGMAQGLQAAKYKASNPAIVKAEIVKELTAKIATAIESLPADVRPFVAEVMADQLAAE